MVLESNRKYAESYDLYISLGDYKDANTRAWDVIRRAADDKWRKSQGLPPRTSGFNMKINYDPGFYENLFDEEE